MSFVCPKCGSKKVTLGNNGFVFGRLSQIFNALTGQTGRHLKGRFVITCMDCGEKTLICKD